MSAAPPWLRLYRRRSRRFEALPLFTRGLANELLTYTDAEGRIDIGTSSESALWRLVGAHPSERRTLAKHLAKLIEIGMIDVTECGWSFPSFEHYQPTSKASAKRTRATPKVPTVGPRSVHDVPTVGPRSVHGRCAIEPKSAESFNTQKHTRGEERERRGEEINVVTQRPSKPPPEAPDPTPSPAELIARFSSGLPPDLLAEAREACALSRRSGRMADSVWAKVLERLSKHPSPAIERGLRVYVDRHADGDKAEAYMLGIVRREASGKPRGGVPQMQPPMEISKEAAAESWRHTADVFGMEIPEEYREAANG